MSVNIMVWRKCIKDADKYFIKHISDDMVKYYNKIVRVNVNKFIIYPICP